MNEPNPESEINDLNAGKGVSKTWKPMSFWRLASKELRETLRDRRTIGTLFLMPLIVYPILSLLFQGFLASGIKQESLSVGGSTEQVSTEEQFVFLFDDEQALNQVAASLNQGYTLYQRSANRVKALEENTDPTKEKIEYNLLNAHNFQFLDKKDGSTVQEMVSNDIADVGIYVLVAVPQENEVRQRQNPIRFRMIYNEDSPRSVKALRLMEGILGAINIGMLKTELRQRGSVSTERIQVLTETIKPAEKKGKSGISFAAIIPLVLTLMTITGAVYPAIDLTAGERERGTLESLIAAPIPRMRILLGKLIAIVSVAMLTAIVNLIGMAITLWVFQFDRVLFGEQGLTLISAAKILGLLMLFAVFFSSLLLVITSFARSFKEGQAYLIPLMMVALAPSLMSLKPDLQLTGLWTVTPLVNIVLLARDVLNGVASWQSTLVTIGTTILYSAVALTMAARFFGTAKVLYGHDQGISTLFRRPKGYVTHASASLSMLCLALLFPLSFISNGILGRMGEQSVTVQLYIAGACLFGTFFLVPYVLTRFHRVRFLEGFSITRPPITSMIAGLLLGMGIGVLLLQGIAWSATLMEQAGMSNDAIQTALVQRGQSQIELLKTAPLWVVLFAMALVPAIFEELFFRGLMFRSLRESLSPWKTILITGVIFGLFHLISSSGLQLSRFIPTTILGIFLGWIRFRSGSVLPGVVVHVLHNAILVAVAYKVDDLVSGGWISEDQTSIPATVLWGATGLTVVGVALLMMIKRTKSNTTLVESDPSVN